MLPRSSVSAWKIMYPVCRKAKLYQYIGLQTDYSNVGQGLITPKMIQSVLAEVTA